MYHFCQGTSNDIAAVLAYNLRGHYARLWRLGIPVDFVEADEADARTLASIARVIMPMPVALDGALFAKLSGFVEAGGTLISEACPGRFDRHGFCPREQMVAGGEALFGARHAAVPSCGSPGGQPRWTPQERGWGEFAPATDMTGTGRYASHSLRASFYLQTLEVTDGEPILRAGDAVTAVANGAGRGRAVLLGTFSGMSATAHIHPESDRFWESLLAEAAVLRRTAAARCCAGDACSAASEAWFLINRPNEEVTESVDVTGYVEVRDLFGAQLERAENSVQLSVSAAGVACLVLNVGGSLD